MSMVPSAAAILPVPFLQSLSYSGKTPGRGEPDQEPAQHSRATRRPRNRVLLFGRIRELALYRAEVLQSQGYTVSTPQTKEESFAAIRRGNFDVAILTYTLSSETVQELAELIREYCPDSGIIAISNSTREDREINPDAIVLADEGPPALIAALRKVTRRP